MPRKPTKSELIICPYCQNKEFYNESIGLEIGKKGYIISGVIDCDKCLQLFSCKVESKLYFVTEKLGEK